MPKFTCEGINVDTCEGKKEGRVVKVTITPSSLFRTNNWTCEGRKKWFGCQFTRSNLRTNVGTCEGKKEGKEEKKKK